MRMTTLAIASALMACVAVPAVAATKGEPWTPTYNTCEALAMNRGITINERRASDQGPSAYRQFMVSCLAGKVEGKPIVTARVAPAPQIPEKWDACDALAAQRGIPENDRRASEAGPSSWRQFMVACLAGKVKMQ
jgi:hypothetical protein